ncbi:hypothetical protein HK101_008266 [Irineochytrium annulatum]|nr:hypothetical protein HK101_008266 [Irineochytrium annulatum]
MDRTRSISQPGPNSGDPGTDASSSGSSSAQPSNHTHNPYHNQSGGGGGSGPLSLPSGPASVQAGSASHYTLSNMSEYSQVIMGCLVSSCAILRDLSGHRGMFFVFPEISVRTSGTYRLKFDLFDMAHPKAFPGMSDSTALTKCFVRQGVRIHIRPGHGDDGGDLDGD